VRREPFELRVEDLKSFGGRKPRAIVATLGPAQALMELQAEHERLMQRVGLEPEGRKFTPHITLARLRDASSYDVAEYLSLRGGFRAPPFKVSGYRFAAAREAPRQGEHGAGILREAGYDAAAIDALVAAGVVRIS